ncbi:glucose/mannose transport system substrate-binding protein [Agrobacterium tumefaciens]|uniref:ABC transporter substrate-binding protein n=1 Tax=Agrobacterium tumefaciens complex TaxID=1183400 RepID=UPI000B3F83A0|nr:ABC transporter substrate-binding protein [Agrobacterium tumefaciens]MBP2510770.1 glucose/mannose transport system substrate-binding protein [Agrobacterium tumefaciens]MBP2520031.1 glucose/mannose transport system substrate-binding protein [Agrobacterium tumefaciens]MBP2573376.1 glucose/mannose transport system substrate-binding protein [Agrobacterium tumefaciens]MBP2578701.1 glucose/mannose transport system substrate-binding protein [Agrobacterium tumefaciens]MBP2596994.1 glucose/mannose t
MRKFLTGTALAVSMMAGAAQAAENVEVLHWWTSGGEAAALDVLKKDLEAKNISWTDMPVAGGGGTEAMTVLRARVTAGNAPTAVQMLGFDIQDWAKEGALGNLDELAAKDGWDKVIPKALQRFSKYDGHWIAAPVNVHSTNWMWINKAALDKAGGKEPKNWDELIAMLDNFKAQGITPIAAGGQPWQDATIFDAVVLSLGTDFYKQAFIDLDPAALGGEKMKTAFERMTKLRSYVDDNFSGRDWNLASAMVIEGKAGVQFMGDWAKGEFVKAKKVPGTDFVCVRYPETQGAVTFNSDQFAMFKVAADKVPAQMEMAAAIESPTFQSAFNVVKGSAPARSDVSNEAFDACGKKAIADLAEADKSGKLFGSMAHGHANPAAVKNAIYDVVTREFNGELTPDEAIVELPAAVAAAK